MAGASAMILFPSGAHDVVASWERIVASRASRVEERDFWLAPPSAGEGGLGFCSRVIQRGAPEWELEKEECESVRAVFGFEPALGISIAALSRGVDSDRVLGELALALLEEHDGALLFHGLLSPTRDLIEWRNWHQKPRSEQVALFPEAIGPHSGKVVAATLDGEATYHVVDKAFLAFWLRHSAFHFVN